MANAKKVASDAYTKFVTQYLKTHSDVVEGSLFGMPCLKHGGKAFAGAYDGGLVVKLPPDLAEKTLADVEGAAPFDPSGKGKPMKGWIVLPTSARRRWKRLADAGVDNVS